MANTSRSFATRRLSWAAAVLAAGLCIISGTALGADAPKQQNSAKAGKILKEANDDLKNKKFAEAIAKLKEADATAGKNAYDQHTINDMLGYAYAHTNDYANAMKAWEAELDDGFLTPADQQQRVRALTGAAYQIKNYDKAIEYGQRAIKGGYADEQMKTIVGQSYYLKGDWKNTLKFEEGMVESTIKAGGTPANEQLQLILSSCVKLDDSACTTKALEKVVTYHPTQDAWYQLLFSLNKETANSDANTLQVYRLMYEVDVLKSPDDFNEMANLALDAGSPGEAERALQRGFDKNVFTDQRAKEKNQRLLEKSKKQAASDQATLDKTAKEADASPTGAKNAGMGLAYFGYGQYDKAADELGKAVSKGGLRNPSETQLLLGIAQLKSGHKEDAVKAFKAVKGDPILERLASLWSLHARQV
jgi:tetratricopeptide (TPR) repeat protein